MERRVSLFRNGRNQAIRIPRQFEFPGDAVLIRKEGDCLIVRPAPRQAIGAALKGVRPLDPADWMDPVEDRLPDAVEV
ncbi:antitoxin [Methylobacterium nigriterrae]|uniref:antitoxin n=1 Tax=Methylobacterium nigriterrae TaxID=3127512 RepID=UPI0030141909